MSLREQWKRMPLESIALWLLLGWIPGLVLAYLALEYDGLIGGAMSGGIQSTGKISPDLLTLLFMTVLLPLGGYLIGFLSGWRQRERQLARMAAPIRSAAAAASGPRRGKALPQPRELVRPRKVARLPRG
jgi:hypothetical protein